MKGLIVSFVLIILLFFSSCSNSKDNDREAANTTTIDLTESEKQNLVIDDFFTLKKIVLLATDENSLIKNIAKVYLHRENIILFDNFTDEIFHYDTTGLLIRKISNIGKGPGEYMAISDIIVDFDENIYYVLDGAESRKVIKYTLEGKFIDEYHMELYTESFYRINDNSFAFYCGNSSSGISINDENSFNNLVYTDSLFNTVSSALPIDKKWAGYAFTSGSMKTYFYKTNEGAVKFIPQLPSNMTIYNVEETAADVSIYKYISFPSNSSMENLLDGLNRNEVTDTFDKLNREGFTYNLHSYMGNKCFTFFTVSNAGYFSNIVLNNSNEQVYYESRENVDKKHGDFHPYPVWTPSAHNISVNILTPDEILQDDFEVATPLREDIDINDNPVLVFYEFRNCYIE